MWAGTDDSGLLPVDRRGEERVATSGRAGSGSVWVSSFSSLEGIREGSCTRP